MKMKLLLTHVNNCDWVHCKSRMLIFQVNMDIVRPIQAAFVLGEPPRADSDICWVVLDVFSLIQAAFLDGEPL